MEAKKHSAYTEEAVYLKETVSWLKNETIKLKLQDNQLNEEIASLRKEVSSALDERLVLKLQMQGMLEEDIDKFKKVEDKPYFGRVNFREDYKEEVETIYIGKFGLYDAEQGEMLVLDWRAPMSNIYYSGFDEEVSYHTPIGNVQGKVSLKRRYVIEQGELLEIYDEKSLQDTLKDSIQQDSGFLIESLNKSTSGRLSEIIATIQDQQNKIIRSEPLMPLVVQGVAGSGKTTIALHRMAYIIYNKQKQDKNVSYMVVAPNRLFLNYIEEILPDLGVDDVSQTTFEDWALEQLNYKITLVNTVDKLNYLLSDSTEEARIISLAAKLRGSIVFKRLIDMQVARLEKKIIPVQGIQFEGKTLITYKELQEVFLVSNGHLALEDRIKLLGQYLKKRLKDKQDIIRHYIEIEYQSKIEDLKSEVEDIESIRKEIISLYDERDERIKGIKKWIPSFVKSYIKNLHLPSTTNFYFNILEENYLIQTLSKQISEEEIVKIIKVLNTVHSNNQFETEDLGPLLYIQMKLYGIKEEKKYAHIVVDEAQDLDEMKITVLRQVSLNDAFTFVGDLSQGIYGYKGINNWERMMKRVFDDKRYNYYEMTTSYRSTIEIIELANEVIRACDEFTPLQAVPVLRHGPKPKLIECLNEEVKIFKILEDIEALKREGMVSICLLTKTKEQSERIYEHLQEKVEDLQLISDEYDKYNGKIVVMPSYLSKGLEFDAVLLYEIGVTQIDLSSLNIKLLYVMITRALHRLYLYYTDDVIPLISESKAIDKKETAIVNSSF